MIEEAPFLSLVYVLVFEVVVDETEEKPFQQEAFVFSIR